MAQYTLIFTVALLLNVIITFRSSAFWSKYAHYFPVCLSCIPGDRRGGKSTTSDDDDEDPNKKKSNAADEDEEEVDPLLRNATNNDSAKKSALSVSEEKKAHRELLIRYLIVYLLATLSDWLQGPYVYALYDAYAYSQHDIAVLFVAGFGSSMIFGSFIGGMADWCGRRKFVILFSAIYAASCMTKHFRDFNILMLGRLLGGVATSLLFSVFDAWLIRSHADRNIDKKYLSASFSSAAYSNSIIAIIAGLIANRAASFSELKPYNDPVPDTTNNFTITDGKDNPIFHVGGFINPFDVALLCLILCGICAFYLWDENYGDERYGKGNNDDSNNNSDADSEYGHGGNDKDPQRWYDGLRNAFRTTMQNRDVLLCGIVSSLFEGSMYVFVFMWTPALTARTDVEDTTLEAGEKEEDGSSSHGNDVKLPFGIIFSTFMVCCMAGSSLFSISIERIKGEALAVLVFTTSSLAMLIVTLSQSDTITFLAMNLFEMCVGMYFPIMGTMKSTIVPEDKRAAIYNLYRIPLNFIVLFSLLTNLSHTQSFLLCGVMLGVATMLQVALMKRRLNMGSLKELSDKGMVVALTTQMTGGTMTTSSSNNSGGGEKSSSSSSLEEGGGGRDGIPTKVVTLDKKQGGGKKNETSKERI